MERCARGRSSEVERARGFERYADIMQARPVRGGCGGAFFPGGAQKGFARPRRAPDSRRLGRAGRRADAPRLRADAAPRRGYAASRAQRTQRAIARKGHSVHHRWRRRRPASSASPVRAAPAQAPAPATPRPFSRAGPSSGRRMSQRLRLPRAAYESPGAPSTAAPASQRLARTAARPRVAVVDWLRSRARRTRADLGKRSAARGLATPSSSRVRGKASSSGGRGLLERRATLAPLIGLRLGEIERPRGCGGGRGAQAWRHGPSRFRPSRCGACDSGAEVGGTRRTSHRPFQFGVAGSKCLLSPPFGPSPAPD